MATHPDVNSLSIDAIEEYLEIAKVSIDRRKPDGGIYGYPAALLLFCVIDALGASLTTGNEHFMVLKQSPFNCKLDNQQVKSLEKWYRNPLAHNAMIAPGVCLSPEDGADPFHFDRNEPVLIRVTALYNLVNTAWRQVDKSTLRPRRLSPKSLPANAADLTNKSAVSGSYIPLPAQKASK